MLKPTALGTAERLSEHLRSDEARILIVEDDGIIAYNLCLMVRKAGFQVAGVSASGEEALKCIAARVPELILVDIHLEGVMDGIELATRVREHSNVPIIFLTALSDVESLQRANATSPLAYLAKPIVPNTLFTWIKIALSKYSVESELLKLRNWLGTVTARVGDAVVVTDSSGTVRFVNVHAELLTGWGWRVAQGVSISTVLPIFDQKSGDADSQLVRSLIKNGSRVPLPSHLESKTLLGVKFVISGEVTPTYTGSASSGCVITFREYRPPSVDNGNPREECGVLALGQLRAGVPLDLNNVLNTILDSAERSLKTEPTLASAISPVCTAIHNAETAIEITRALLAFSYKEPSRARILDWNAVISNVDAFYGQLQGLSVPLGNNQVRDSKQKCNGIDSRSLTQQLIRAATTIFGSGPSARVTTLLTPGIRSEGTCLPSLEIPCVLRNPECKNASLEQASVAQISGPLLPVDCLIPGADLAVALVKELKQAIREHTNAETNAPSSDSPTEPHSTANSVPLLPFRFPNTNSEQGPDTTILVVDDDLAVRRVIVSSLTAVGFTVLSAENGYQALEIANAHPGCIDVLVTDVLLPGLDGPTLSSTLQAMCSGMRTLFVTGAAGDLLRRIAPGLDEASVLTKPFSPSKLVKIVRSILTTSLVPLSGAAR